MMDKYNIAVIGSGGREHAICATVARSSHVEKLYAIPGNAGISQIAECVKISAPDIDGIVAFCKENGINLVFVAPDDPLALGLVDALEGNGIPTAEYATFDDYNEASAYLKNASFPLVIKADGLALGKGVIIAMTRDEAKAAVRSMMEDKIFGESGSNVVIEEFLTGPEVSVLSFTDGKTVIPMISSQDHKRALDNDEGLNTGGMGTVAPNPYYTKDIADVCMETIFLPTVKAMAAEGRAFKGCLYFGLMLTEKGPKVIEYNCRFGDPETQVVLPLLESDLLTVMQATTNETLDKCEVKFSNGNACCVIMASKGYPSSYEKGYEITIPESVLPNVYVAGASIKDSKLVTNGGRVLGVTKTADTLECAISGAYELVKAIKFDNAFYRSDIGKRALMAKENK